MNEPTAEAHPQEFEFIPGQTYKTTEGHEYIVSNIARESGNIEDLFIVYRNTNAPTVDWVIKMTPNISPDDFDKIEYPKPADLNLENPHNIVAGQRYTHFKTRDEYIIKSISIDPNTKTKYVIYEGQYDSEEFGHHPVWIREYEEFAGYKTFDDGREPVKRFAFVN